MQRYFSKEDTQTVIKHMKISSTSVIIRERQIKTTMRYPLMPIRMTIIKRKKKDKCWQRGGKSGILIRYWWEYKMVQTLWKIVRVFFKTILKLLYNPSISLCGIYIEEFKNRILKRGLHTYGY